ncbi:MAG: Holliday junction branch migration protein RuvA [Sutterellaceae bacterium]|nr:Holliday junction branch migration protein RuvA [Sutterellaceae bacterium]MDD7441133.1 Holliday junction branch migration protein RuvA [Sutterellaceae bacterium]MDY2867464.1 Holliday junction branch migration protein RuvA [Mesosutterella sp.]
MIAMLKGRIAEKSAAGIILDVNGVGYELSVPMSTFCSLPDVGHEAKLFVQMTVREDAILLYGFLTREEKSAFQALLKVSGIGAKTALAVLSGLTVPDLASAVANEQSDLLTRVPGIGKKTAARLVLELKGKLGSEFAAGGGAAPAGILTNVQADVVAGLIALGYSDREAAATARNIPPDATVEEGIRIALRSHA